MRPKFTIQNTTKALSYFDLALKFGHFVGIECFKAVAQGGVVLKYAGQCVEEVFGSLDVVVKDYDGALCGIVDDVVQALIGGDHGVKIGAQHIPHDYPVVPLQKLGLLGSEPTVWWPEQHRMGELGAMSDVVKVGNMVGGPAIEVIESVVAHRVACFDYLFEDVGMFLDVITYTKEGSFCLVSFQTLEHPRCDVRYGAVVKSEVEHFFLGGYPPGEVRKKMLNDVWRFDQIHVPGYYK